MLHLSEYVKINSFCLESQMFVDILNLAQKDSGLDVYPFDDKHEKFINRDKNIEKIKNCKYFNMMTDQLEYTEDDLLANNGLCIVRGMREKVNGFVLTTNNIFCYSNGRNNIIFDQVWEWSAKQPLILSKAGLYFIELSGVKSTSEVSIEGKQIFLSDQDVLVFEKRCSKNVSLVSSDQYILRVNLSLDNYITNMNLEKSNCIEIRLHLKKKILTHRSKKSIVHLLNLNRKDLWTLMMTYHFLILKELLKQSLSHHSINKFLHQISKE